MKKRLLSVVVGLCCCVMHIKAQISVLDKEMMNAYLESLRYMSERVIEIRKAVRPYREQQCLLYNKGRYREAMSICIDVINDYVYYKYDNRAISDMEIVAGDCAVHLKEYDTAISFYKMAIEADDANAVYGIQKLFHVKIGEARDNYNKNSYDSMCQDVIVASKTGLVSGEYYYYLGVFYEYKNDFKKAKKMYKSSRKLDFSPAVEALSKLKQKRNRK